MSEPHVKALWPLVSLRIMIIKILALLLGAKHLYQTLATELKGFPA